MGNDVLPNIYDHHGYGEPKSEPQKPIYWGEMPSGPDGYGNPTYGDGYGGGYSYGGGQRNSGVLPQISPQTIERTQQRIEEESHVSIEKNSNKKETKPKTDKKQEQPKKEDDKVKDSNKDIILPKFKENKDDGIKATSDKDTNKCVSSHRKKIFLKTDNNQKRPKKEKVKITKDLPNNTDQLKLIQKKGQNDKVNYRNTINKFPDINKKGMKIMISMNNQSKKVNKDNRLNNTNRQKLIIGKVDKDKNSVKTNINNCVIPGKNKIKLSNPNQTYKKTNSKSLETKHNKVKDTYKKNPFKPANKIIKFKPNNKSKSPPRPNVHLPIITGTTIQNQKTTTNRKNLYKSSCRPGGFLINRLKLN